MKQHLPTGNFRWLSTVEMYDIIGRLESISATGKRGYIFEVDLRYPRHLHDAHSDYPLAPEHLDITADMLSPFQNATFPTKKLGKSRKLAPNLYDKEKYVVHYRNLQYYLAKGMVVTRIHRVLQFDQSPWLETYIDFNTKQRAAGTTEFEKSFFKLMNNAVFGEFTLYTS